MVEKMQDIKIMLGVLLLAESVIDIKSKQVWLWMPLCIGSVGIGYRVLHGYTNTLELVVSLIVVLLFFIISKITKESLGRGDVWVIGSILLAIGLKKGMEIIFLGFLLAGIYGGILMIVKKCSGKKSIPFIPFLLVGFLGGVCI